MPLYESIVNIQWAISTEAIDYTDAKAQIHQTVVSLLNDIRYQEISDESIDIDVREV
jgi:hypothetical protein